MTTTQELTEIEHALAVIESKQWTINQKRYCLKTITIADSEKLKTLIPIAVADNTVNLDMSADTLAQVLNIILVEIPNGAFEKDSSTNVILTPANIPEHIAADILTNFFYTKLLSTTKTQLSLPCLQQLKKSTTQNQKSNTNTIV